MKQLLVPWFSCTIFFMQTVFVSTLKGQAVPAPKHPTPTVPSLPGLDDLPEVKPRSTRPGTAAKVPSETPKNPEYEVMRVLSPGVFDVKTDSFLVRFRSWGVGFPRLQ